MVGPNVPYTRDYLFFFFLFLKVSLSQMINATTLGKSSVNDLTTTALHRLLCEERRQGNSSLRLIDVREEHEIEASGRIAGSHHIPFSIYENDRETFVAAFQALTEKHNRVIVYCRSGRRSRIVGEHMVNQEGYEDVYDMLGGLLAWEADRLPIESKNTSSSSSYSHLRWAPAMFARDTGIVAE
ncbi:Rhodanese-like domain-containing protein [Dichotomocladium elegans]|nr:Rhodanese-like domain-containing protein [Dichotomocladium elegans]